MKQGIGWQFMEQTRHRHLGPADQQLGGPPPPVVAEYDPLLSDVASVGKRPAAA